MSLGILISCEKITLIKYKYSFHYFYLLIGLFCRTLHSFSIIRNIKTIMSTNVGKRDLRYLHGIRVLSLFWIILLHVTFSAVVNFWPYGK